MLTRVLLSGGLDSTVCLAMAKAHRQPGDSVDAIIFNYQQRHLVEIHAARRIADICRVSAQVVELSPWASADTALAGDSTAEASGPAVVVPGRNRAMLLAAAGTQPFPDALVMGACADDQELFEDCRPGFFAHMRTELRTRVEVPLIDKSKADVVRLAGEYGASSLLGYTHSCYLGARPACGWCLACKARLMGFHEAWLHDPIPYAHDSLRVPCPACSPREAGSRCHHPAVGYINGPCPVRARAR